LKKPTEEKEFSASLVEIDKAKQEIAAHQMWGRFVPEEIIVDTENKTVSYPQITVTDEDYKLLKAYYDHYKKVNKIKGNTVPFRTELSYSYYIRKEDILKAFEDDLSANGINVYVAMKGLHKDKLNSLKSHLFIVPTHKKHENSNIYLEDKLIKGKYVLDLTDPCPNLCDKNSILYQPELQPYKKQ
jgi:hypothetical protein